MVGRNVREAPEARGVEIVAPTRAELDLSDRAAVERAILAIAPDIVVHAAGRVGGIEANIRDPAGFLTENVEMGINLVRAAEAAGVKRLINLSSSCVYPRDAPNPLREEAVLSGPLEPTNEGYALAKVVTMRLCEYLSSKDPDLRYRTIIPCNLYGPYDHFSAGRSHLVAAIVRKLHDAVREGAPTVEVWGDGTARREFLYVGDLAAFLHEAIGRFDELPTTMNVGVGRDHTINEYYETAARVVGFEGTFTHDLTRPVGMMQKLVDTTRLGAFGWKASTPLEAGLARTYEHFLKVEVA